MDPYDAAALYVLALACLGAVILAIRKGPDAVGHLADWLAGIVAAEEDRLAQPLDRF